MLGELVVGNLVGRKLGDLEGKTVGGFEGDFVGRTLGDLEGDTEGPFDGLKVGPGVAIVGFEVGSLLGGTISFEVG